MNKALLMKKYLSGDIGPEDQKLLESYIEQGIINVDEFEDLEKLREDVNLVPGQIPSEQMKEKFYKMLADEKRKVNHLNLWDRFWNVLAIDLPVGQYSRVAFTVVILMIGLITGWLLSPVHKYQNQLSDINTEVHQMKEMMMLSMLEKPSATERLRAVSMSSEIPASYGKVVDALFNTLNNDENVNVRLAALEALAGYSSDPVVRENLVSSINGQESPLVQIEMADLMVALQEKGSVKELKKLIEKEETDPAIKKELEESIVKII